MKKVFLALCLVLAAPVQAETVDKILAKVGGEVITQSELNEAVQAKRVSLTQKYGEQDGAARFQKFRANALEEMVLQKILEAEIKEANISVPGEAVEREFQSRVRFSGKPEAAFIGELARAGLSLADYKQALKKELEERQFIEKNIMPGIDISDAELQQEYRRNASLYKEFAKVRFTEVFLSPENFKSNEELMGVATEIRDALAKGRPAGELIRRYSSGTYSAQGGDSGLIDIANLREDLRGVLNALKPGETSPVLPSNQGVFIFKMVAKAEPRPLPYTAVTNQLRMRVGEKRVQEALRRHLQGVKEQTYVEIQR